MTHRYFKIKRALAQGLVEYGLIIAFVALLAVSALLLFRPSLPSLLSNLSTSV
jgi:Flp pilus assembly pilin Flp